MDVAHVTKCRVTTDGILVQLCFLFKAQFNLMTFVKEHLLTLLQGN